MGGGNSFWEADFGIYIRQEFDIMKRRSGELPDRCGADGAVARKGGLLPDDDIDKWSECFMF